MTKSKSKPRGLMMTARVVEIAGEGIALNDGKRPQSFVLYFDEAVEELDVGDMVTVTIVKSEAQDG